LVKLIEIFRQVDSDNNGIINEEEFRDLMDMTTISFSEVDLLKFLNEVDPYRLNQITFS